MMYWVRSLVRSGRELKPNEAREELQYLTVYLDKLPDKRKNKVEQ